MMNWRNPVIVGPVVAAMIAAVGAVVLWLFATSSPIATPFRPSGQILSALKRDAQDGSDVLVVSYADADDNENGSGVKEVRLWFRYLKSGSWEKTELAKTGQSGTFVFAGLNGSGRYSFDLVATDQSENQSASPNGTDGQRDYHFVMNEDPPAPAGAAMTGPELALREFRRDQPEFVENLEWINIPVYFHIVHDGSAGNVGDDLIHRQITVLNRAFFDGQIGFTLVEINRVDNAEWHRLAFGTPVDREMKTAIQRDPKKGLNVYTVELSGGMLEYSTFPFNLERAPESDGCVILYSTLPGGESAPFNLGHQLVHGVGHWLGLYHTFQDGCSGKGDFVDDTVAHAGPNWGKPEVGLRHNACDPNAAAPVQNFMNYVDDDWMNHFTPGQFTRMKEMIGKYRSELLGD